MKDAQALSAYVAKNGKRFQVVCLGVRMLRRAREREERERLIEEVRRRE